MAARVAAPPNFPQSLVNTDPGVYEPECDWGGPAEPTGYPDTEQFLNGYAGGSGEAQAEETQPGPPAAPLSGLDTQQSLPLAGDYQGLGGPTSVPLYTPAAFFEPARPVEKTILDEIFLEPTDRQLDAYYRVILRGKVYVIFFKRCRANSSFLYFQCTEQEQAEVGHLRALPPAVPHVVEAHPRGVGQAGRLRTGGGGTLRSSSAALGVAVASVSSRDDIRSEHLQTSQPQELQTVPQRDPHLLPPPCRHRHGLPRPGLLRVPHRGPH